MRVFYEKGADISILDSVVGFQAVCEKLTRFLRDTSGSIFLDAKSKGSAERYEKLLLGIEIVKRGIEIQVSVVDEKLLRIEGSLENLQLFLSAFCMSEKDEGNHRHPDHQFKDGFMGRDSLRIIIEIDSDHALELDAQESS